VVVDQQPSCPRKVSKTTSTSKKRTQPSRSAKDPLSTSITNSSDDVIVAHEVIFTVVYLKLY